LHAGGNYCGPPPYARRRPDEGGIRKNPPGRGSKNGSLPARGKRMRDRATGPVGTGHRTGLINAERSAHARLKQPVQRRMEDVVRRGEGCGAQTDASSRCMDVHMNLERKRPLPPPHHRPGRVPSSSCASMRAGRSHSKWNSAGPRPVRSMAPARVKLDGRVQ